MEAELVAKSVFIIYMVYQVFFGIHQIACILDFNEGEEGYFSTTFFMIVTKILGVDWRIQVVMNLILATIGTVTVLLHDNNYFV